MYSQVANVLNESIGATTITKHILNFVVSFTVSKLLASPTIFDKQLTKAIAKDKVIQFQVNTLDLVKTLETFSFYS